MSEEKTNNTPSHLVYFIKNTEGGEQYWQRVGAAWEHKDQKGLTQKIDFFGLNVELVIRENDVGLAKDQNDINSTEPKP